MDEITRLVERVERAALEALHACATAAARERAGLRLESVGTAAVSIAANADSIVLNRAVGLGIEEPASPESIEAIAACYAAAGVDRYYVHLNSEARPAELRGWLLGAGLERLRGWMKFARGADRRPPAAKTDLSVRRVDAGQADEFGRIVAGGFGMAPAAAPALASLASHPQWRVYMTFDGDAAAGAAAMFVHEDTAWLDFAATRPEFRRRGSQSALLRQRINDAIDAGCRLMLTTTGEAVEGDAQHSYKNILRWGFETLGLRENYGPAPQG